MKDDFPYSFSPGGIAAARRLLVSFLKDKTDVSVLIVGSQYGELALRIAKDFPCRVTGIEVDTEAIMYARMVAESNKLSDKVDFAFMDPTSLKLPEKSFDVVLTDNIFSMYPRQKTLATLVKLMHPEGTFCIIDSFWRKTPVPTYVQSLWESDDNKVPTEDEWIALIEETGLSLRIFEERSKVLGAFYRQFREEVHAMTSSKFEGMKHQKSLIKHYKHEIDVFLKQGGDKYMGHFVARAVLAGKSTADATPVETPPVETPPVETPPTEASPETE